MSLYDDEVDNQGASGWSTGIKLLQSHVQLKKVTGPSHRKAVPSIAPVIDLNRSKDRVNSDEMPAIPLYVPKGGASLLGGEWLLKDEYDPLYPNEYDRLNKQLRREHGDKRSEKSDRKSEHKSSNDSPSQSRRQSAMIAPPASLTQETSPAISNNNGFSPPLMVPEPPPASAAAAVASNMSCSSVAARIMAKMGFKAGQGLGKSEQGISSALAVEKTSHRGGKIVDMSSAPSSELQNESMSPESMPPPSMMMPPPPMAVPPPPAPVPAPTQNLEDTAELLKAPTKVVLLRNMVGPGEVDDDLEPETKEECSHYGDVLRVVIYELPGPGVNPEEAVRIFVEFKSVAHAVKAVVDLNGRFFGGRVVRAGFYEQEKFNRLELI